MSILERDHFNIKPTVEVTMPVVTVQHCLHALPCVRHYGESRGMNPPDMELECTTLVSLSVNRLSSSRVIRYTCPGGCHVCECGFSVGLARRFVVVAQVT